MQPQKRRIEFIDLAKGICILLVVLLHSGGPARILPGYEIVRMPLYYILSGLFYKDYGGIKNLCIKKTNKLIVPYLFFAIVPFVLFYAVRGEGFVNSPIWFLLSLFWCNILFYYVNKFAKATYLKIPVIGLLGLIGMYWYKLFSVNALLIDTSLAALPFFCAGYYLKKSSILYQNKYDKYNLVFAFGLWLISFSGYMYLNPKMDFLYHIYTGFDAYIIAFCSVLSILFICKTIKHIPFVSYIGRYSVVILCIHYCLIKVWHYNMDLLPEPLIKWWWLFATIILSSALCIPLFIKYLPKFTAQKDLIEVTPNDRIVWSKS